MNHFKEFETTTDINLKNAFIKILSQPKSVLIYILKHHPSKHVYLLFIAACIISIADSLGHFILFGSFINIIPLLFGASIFGCLFYIVFAFTLNYMGILLKGSYKFTYYKTILAWAQIPKIISLFIVLINITFQYVYYNTNLITDESLLYHVQIITTSLVMVIELWVIIIIIKGIMLIQNFSIGRAIANYLIPFLFFAFFIVAYKYLS